MHSFKVEQLAERELMAANFLDASVEPEPLIAPLEPAFVSSFQTGGTWDLVDATLDQSSTMFQPDGQPLRAKLDVTLKK